jgi:hypothetical protein
MRNLTDYQHRLAVVDSKLEAASIDLNKLYEFGNRSNEIWYKILDLTEKIKDNTTNLNPDEVEKLTKQLADEILTLEHDAEEYLKLLINIGKTCVGCFDFLKSMVT